MKYLILVYSNPTTRQLWSEMPTADRARGYQAYAALTESLVSSGELIVCEALSDPSQTTRIMASDGQVLTTDGPFAEVKELLAGFYLIECEGRERAIAVAARVPEAEFGLVEIRPVMDISGHEL